MKHTIRWVVYAFFFTSSHFNREWLSRYSIFLQTYSCRAIVLIHYHIRGVEGYNYGCVCVGVCMGGGGGGGEGCM